MIMRTMVTYVVIDNEASFDEEMVYFAVIHLASCRTQYAAAMGSGGF